MILELSQTLHGYDNGHRLLAEGGDLSEEERAILDPLSDLSGYLPTGLAFDHYHTGFPCGRYYAFACTWLDTAAQRGGTVLTHTLLLPRDKIEHVADLWALARAHRRPATAEDRAAYEQVLTLEVDAEAPPLALDEGRARAVLSLYLGQRERPILWLDPVQPVAEVRALWRLPVPSWRERFSFCTLALQELRLGDQPFVLLGVPPEAQGAFHKFAASRAWWRAGQLEHAELGESEFWQVAAEREGGLDELLAELVRDCERMNLPMIARPDDLNALRKFLQVRDGSRQRLTAARARVDLLARLWPELPVGHSEWHESLDTWLEWQPAAPLKPRPLWELTYLLGKPQVWALFDHSWSFGNKLTEMVDKEFSTRLQAAPELVFIELDRLLQQVRQQPVANAICRHIENWNSRHSSEGA